MCHAHIVYRAEEAEEEKKCFYYNVFCEVKVYKAFAIAILIKRSKSAIALYICGMELAILVGITVGLT